MDTRKIPIEQHADKAERMPGSEVLKLLRFSELRRPQYPAGATLAEMNAIASQWAVLVRREYFAARAA